jgi:hypothetical protein
VDKVLNNFFIDWGKLEKLSKAEFLSKIGNRLIQSLPKCLSRAQSIDLPVNQVIHSKPVTLTITTNLINSLDIKPKRASCSAHRLPAGQDPLTSVYQMGNHIRLKKAVISLSARHGPSEPPRTASKFNAGGRSPQADRAAVGKWDAWEAFVHKPG